MRFFQPVLRLGVYEDLRHRLRSSLASDYVCLVAVVTLLDGESDLVGTVEITFRSTSPFQFRSLPYPYLSNLAVRLEARRQGVAQTLLRRCETIALDLGFQDLYLHVLEDNHQARQLYTKAGYQSKQTDSLWYCWFFRQPQKLLMHKRLARLSQ
ncbi:GNAT family N-acetyltransferase [Stenomitos frigidus]|uniref:GNAT family N-acetyltransferase n=1 Tax=Stenomitos frigidus ULC18 TaxID=2107698 RepID=A0A2T1DZ61_9CYAN|nr:GNAT family N-acetyltransferase [Stenomitos frigidus]PSB25785.1 GNAT family N-acetyltransferase [Stenomitos frigidus ULC18]